jgi:predicted ArsR family transcriptional regulator
MADTILKAFKEKKKMNIPELVLKLQIDKNSIKKTLDNLVDTGRLRVEKKPSHKDGAPARMTLGCRCSISGPSGKTYILND